MYVYIYIYIHIYIYTYIYTQSGKCVKVFIDIFLGKKCLGGGPMFPCLNFRSKPVDTKALKGLMNSGIKRS